MIYILEEQQKRSEQCHIFVLCFKNHSRSNKMKYIATHQITCSVVRLQVRLQYGCINVYIIFLATFSPRGFPNQGYAAGHLFSQCVIYRSCPFFFNRQLFATQSGALGFRQFDQVEFFIFEMLTGFFTHFKTSETPT